MRILAGMLLGGALLLLAGCTARHVVVERDVGRVDGARSITTSSDLQWRVEREPASGANADR